jgi:hypothetical protein
MVPAPGSDKVVTCITKWLLGRTCCSEERGVSETLTATGQSGLAATRLLGRSEASPSEAIVRAQASWECWSENPSAAMSHVEKEEKGQSSQTGIERRAEDGISTMGGGRPSFRETWRRQRNRAKHPQYRGGRYSRCLHRKERGEPNVRRREEKKIESNKERSRTTALNLLSAAYARIFEQQEELYSLKLERLETKLQKEYVSQMSSSSKANSRDSSRTSEAASSAMATPMMSNLESHYPRMGIFMPLPQPGAAGTPHFTGKNVSKFLKAWEHLCGDYGVSLADKLEKLPRYCDQLIGDYIETIPEYQAKDWNGLKKRLLREYRREDAVQQMETLRFLETFKNQKRNDGDDMRIYCLRFATISKRLVEKGELSRYEQVRWFVQGMPKKMAERTVRIAKLDPEESETMDFDKAYEAALSQIRSEDAMETIGSPTEQYDSALGELAKGVEASTNEKAEPKWDISTPITAAVPAVQEGIVDSITKGLAALTLPVKAMEASINSLSAKLDASVRNDGQNRRYTAQRSDIYGTAANTGTLPGFCFTCGKPGCRSYSCPWTREMIETGRLHRNENGNICLGPPRQGAQEVITSRGTTLKETVERIWARQEQYRDQLPPPKVSYISVCEGSSDSEGELPVHDDLYDAAEIRAATVGPSGRRGRPPKYPQAVQGEDHRVRKPEALSRPQDRQNKERLQQAIAKEQQYPVMRAPRTGTYETAQGQNDMDVLDAPVPASGTPEIGEEIVVGAGGKRAEPRQQRTKLAKLLKESFEPEALTKEILQMKVPVPMGQLLSTREFQKVWFNTFPAQPDHPLAGAAVNKLEAAPPHEEDYYASPLEPPFYIAAVPKVKALIAGREVSVMLDSGAEVSVMSSDLAHRLGLPISSNVDLGMLGVSDKRTKFLGICEDVSVSVGRVEHRVPIWVAERFGPEILLGRPYFIQSRLVLKDHGGGACRGTIMSSDGVQQINFQAVAANAPENRTREDLIRAKTLNAPAEI